MQTSTGRIKKVTNTMSSKRKIIRFPSHFMFKITEEEKEKVVANCDHLPKLKFSPYLPDSG